MTASERLRLRIWGECMIDLGRDLVEQGQILTDLADAIEAGGNDRQGADLVADLIRRGSAHAARLSTLVRDLAETIESPSRTSRLAAQGVGHE